MASSDAHTQAPPTGSKSIASPPFNNPSADLILVTTDRVAFHVWRCILAEASPVFADMFALGTRELTTGGSDGDGNSSSGTTPVPTLEVAETSSTLDGLLRLCYPIPNVPIASFDQLNPTLRAAHKYQMDGAIAILACRLTELVAHSPLRAYALAIRYDLKDVACISASRFLIQPWNPVEDCVPELDDISANAYRRLLAYRRQCADTLAEMCAGLEWLSDTAWMFTRCSMCTRDTTVPTCRLRGTDVDQKPATWFWQHYRRMAALLQERPCVEAISEPQLITQALKVAMACGTCRDLAPEHMLLFMCRMKREVTRRVEKITLEYK